MERLTIEIAPSSGDTFVFLSNGLEISTNPPIVEALEDCTRSGDATEACKFLRDQIGVDFTVVARASDGTDDEVLATAQEKQKFCEHVYFESETDFSDEDWADLYIIWEAAHQYTQQNESEVA